MELVPRESFHLNTHATAPPNGAVETRTYDGIGRLASIATTDGVGGPVVFSATYTRDADGRITVALENQAGAAHEYDYAYDADGRLVQETVDPSSANPRVYTYTYDLAGNRVRATDSGDGSGASDLTYSYDADGRLVEVDGTDHGSYSDSTSTYDLAGNTLTVTSGNQVTTNTWDPEGRLVSVVTAVNGATTRTVTYTYDVAGDRTSETVDGQTTTFLNDPTDAYDLALEEYAPGGVLAATYVRGYDLLFQGRTAAGGGTGDGLSYYVHDGLGSTRALTDASGSVTDAYAYDPYGNLTSQTWTGTAATPNDFLYAGYRTGPTPGAYLTASRVYDASAGRFTSRDSYDGRTDDPITQNHYLYAGADPVGNIDPSGHAEFSLGGISVQVSTSHIFVSFQATASTSVLTSLIGGFGNGIANVFNAGSPSLGVISRFGIGFLAGFTGTFIGNVINAKLDTIPALKPFAAVITGGSSSALTSKFTDLLNGLADGSLAERFGEDKLGEAVTSLVSDAIFGALTASVAGKLIGPLKNAGWSQPQLSAKRTFGFIAYWGKNGPQGVVESSFDWILRTGTSKGGGNAFGAPTRALFNASLLGVLGDWLSSTVKFIVGSVLPPLYSSLDDGD